MKKATFLILTCFQILSFFTQVNTWNGNTDTDWHKSCNWSLNTIPTVSHDVVIPIVTNYPVVTGNAHCKTLSITSTASTALTINSSGGADLCITSTNGGSCSTTATDNGGCASAVAATDTYGMMAFGTWTGSGVKGAGAVFVIYDDGTWGFNTGGTWSGPPDGTYTGTWLSGAPTTPVNLEWRLTEYNSTSGPFNSPGSSWTSPVSTTPWGTTNVSANIATACGSGGGITRYLGCKVEFRNSVTLVVVATHYFSAEIGC